MKKHTLRIISAAALVSLLFFGGCSDTLDTDSPVQSNSSLGTLRVQIGGGDARTLIPDSAEITDYTVEFSNGSTTVQAAKDGNTFSASIEPGKWTIKATGYVGPAGNRTKAISGQKTVTLNAGDNTGVTIYLTDSANNTIPGHFTYSLKFPVLEGVAANYSGYNSATIKLTQQSWVEADENGGTPAQWGTSGGAVTIHLLTPKEFNDDTDTNEYNLITSIAATNTDPAKYEVKGKMELPPGQYLMELILASDRGINGGSGIKRATVYRKEVAYIYPGMETKLLKSDGTTYNFGAADFLQNLYFKGTLPTMTFPASSTGNNYAGSAITYSAPTVINSYQVTGRIVGNAWDITIPSQNIISTLAGTTITTSTALKFSFTATRTSPGTAGVARTFTYTANIASIHGTDNSDLTIDDLSLTPDPVDAFPVDMSGSTPIYSLRATARSGNTITLSWDQVQNAAYYNVMGHTYSSQYNTYTYIQTIYPTGTDATVRLTYPATVATGGSGNHYYWYHVEAVGFDGTPVISNNLDASYNIP